MRAFPACEVEIHISNPCRAPLALSRKVLRLLINLHLLIRPLTTARLIATLIAWPFVRRARCVPPAQFNSKFVFAMRMIMVIGICAAPVVHFICRQLLLFVATVTTGNLFSLFL